MSKPEILMFCSISLFIAVIDPINAETDSNKAASELWLSYAMDENDAFNYSLYLDIGLSLDDSMLIRIGQAQSEIVDQTIQTDQFSLGYSTIRLAPWANTILYEYWGKSNELVVRSLSYDINYFGTVGNAGFTLEYRVIEFYTREFSMGQRRYDVDSPGIGINTGLTSANWNWSLSSRWYDYSENIQNLNSRRGLFLLGLRNFDHADNLNSWYAVTKLNYRFADSDLGLRYSYAVSKITNEGSATLALLYDVDISRVMSLEMEAGRTFEEPDIETDYGLVALGFRF